MTEPPYRILPSRRARRDLERLAEKVATACIEFIDGPLAKTPHLLGKPLSAPFAGLHAARRGSYRIVYRIDEENRAIELIHIDHRSQIYRA